MLFVPPMWSQRLWLQFLWWPILKGRQNNERTFWLFCFLCYLLWWLILCVNLPRQRDAQRAGNALFLARSVRAFLERLSLDLPEWAKRSAIINMARQPATHDGKHVREGQVFSLPKLGCPHSPALRNQSFWVPGLWTLTHTICSPGSQASDSDWPTPSSCPSSPACRR